MFAQLSQAAGPLGAKPREFSHRFISNIEDHQIETGRKDIRRDRLADSAQPDESDRRHLILANHAGDNATMQYVSNQRNRVSRAARVVPLK